MPLRLHAFPVSQPSRAVAWFLKANGITEVGYHVVNLLKGEHLTEEHGSKTPYYAVPILELEDGSFLTESAAILNYLASFFNKRDDYPTDLIAIARIHEAELHHDDLARKVTVTLVRPLLGVFAGAVKLPDAIEGINKNSESLVHALQFLDKLLGKQNFLSGKTFSVADYLATCELNQLPLLGQLPGINDSLKITTYPNLVAYLDRVKAHSPLYEEFLAPFEQAFGAFIGK